MTKKVFISGCYDLLHSGHVRFFEEASTYGNLYVSIASDETIREYKHREPVNTEKEREYLVNAIKFVHEGFISRGMGLMNFADDFIRIKPNYLIVNEDGDIPEKRALCKKYGAECVVLHRKPKTGLPARSTTELLHDIGKRK